MSFKRVPPGNAVTWIGDAVKLLLANPTPFLLMGLVMTVIPLIPILGALGLLIVGPVLYAGIASAARAQASGKGADFNQLMEGFKTEGKAGPLIALCLPGLALLFVFIVLAVVIALSFGAAALTAGAGAGQFDPEMGLVALFGAGGLMMLALLMLPLALAGAALLFFAVARVMFDGLEPFAAMRESAQAAMANLGAFLITVITLFFARALIALVLGSISPLLGALVAGVIFTPLLGALLYTAWADVFGLSEEREARAEHAASPAQASPGPPPSIEA